MRTKPDDVTAKVRRFHEAVDRRPRVLNIGGVEAFWIEDREGTVLTRESATVAPALDATLDAIRNGQTAEDIVLVGRTTAGERHIIGSGRALQVIAEASRDTAPVRRRDVRG